MDGRTDGRIRTDGYGYGYGYGRTDGLRTDTDGRTGYGRLRTDTDGRTDGLRTVTDGYGRIRTDGRLRKSGLLTMEGGTPHKLREGWVQGARKSQKSIFSCLETYSIESGVVDLVGRYQLDFKFMDFSHF